MNPFRPSFGTTPPLLVGRQTQIDDFVAGLQDGPGSPQRATLVTGLRGTGKTVMLEAYERASSAIGWVTIAESASPGMVDRLVNEHLPELLRKYDTQTSDSRVTSVSVPGLGSIGRDVSERHEPTRGLRSQLFALADLLEQRGGGVLITIDEVHRRNIDDVREIAGVIQHGFRKDKQVAFACAGLPSSVDDLLNDDVSTFLRRAERVPLRTVATKDVARALAVPIVESGRQITEEALQIAREGTGGYPFLIQLIGRHTWAAATDDGITAAHAREGVKQARRRIGDLVHAAAFSDLSDVDRSFLVAMAQDDGPSKMSDIAVRLGVTPTYAGQYRSRLLRAEIIESVRYGFVDFSLPGLREFLREHAAVGHVPAAETSRGRAEQDRQASSQPPEPGPDLRR